jgi:aminomethyltransferase
MKRTIFYHQEHQAGATMRQAQGWEMPDHFGDPRAEHLAVRSSAGVFDWASTGEIEIQGRDALALVQKVIVNDASRMPVGRVLYTTMCQPTGAIMSDVTIYRLGEDRYWCMTAWGSNQAGQCPEFDWLLEQARGLDVCVTDVSSGVALLAVQGPKAQEIVALLSPADLGALRYMWFTETSLAGAPRALISRTGYTGELGYELIVAAEYAYDLWDALETAGRPFGLRHAGLETAFSLRMEKGYIARFDFMDGVTPLEAGMGWTVKLDKSEFVGRAALAKQQAEGLRRKLVSVAMGDETLPAGGCRIFHEGAVIGKITSSAYGYSVGCPLALALVSAEWASVGLRVVVEVEGRGHPAHIAPRPIYDAKGTQLRPEGQL